MRKSFDGPNGIIKNDFRRDVRYGKVVLVLESAPQLGEDPLPEYGRNGDLVKATEAKLLPKTTTFHGR